MKMKIWRKNIVKKELIEQDSANKKYDGVKIILPLLWSWDKYFIFKLFSIFSNN